jgi:translation initiation factor IF-2
LPETITVRELATQMNASPINVIRELMNNGVMANINQQLDYDSAAIVAEAFNIEAKPKPIVVKSIMDELASAAVSAGGQLPEDGIATPQHPSTLKKHILSKEGENLNEMRPPIVTIMGHVDHGKTSLLDAIRKSNVAAGEAGGITQHIGAYQIEHQGKKVTFIDTPGHEAFTAMRARGAHVTDIAILVVAADDGVMPQTREAIAHARAAQVPIIVALNKMDRPNAAPDRVKSELSESGLTPDDWGGDTMVVPVSAKQRKGIDDLIEGILLTAESLNSIRAKSDALAVGTIIESKLDKSKGPTATVLIQNGTLNLGDAFVAGNVFGKVRAMFDFRGHRLKKATPSTPVSIIGMTEVPAAGEVLEVFHDERAAKTILAQRVIAKTGTHGLAQRPLTLDQYFAQAKAGKSKKLTLILKTNNQGSLSPIVESLSKLNTLDSEIRLDVINQGIGNITESDVDLAIASGAVVLGFEVSMDGNARRKAEENKVDVRHYDVIYKIIEDVELAMKGMLPPKMVQRTVGTAEVKATFKISKLGIIAGCVVRSGMMQRGIFAKVMRGDKQEFVGKLSTLKRLTEDVREVKQGLECGLSIDGYEGYRPGDIIEVYVEEEEAR